MLRVAAFFLGCLALLGGPRTVAAKPGPPTAVLLMSFDGLGADQFSQRTMPRLWARAQQGLTGRALPPFPSTTFNGHATIATGCWPGHHGIVANGFVDPDRGDLPYTAQADLLQREPLWVAAARSGVPAAVYHWPCGTGPWEGVTPWRLEPFRGREPDGEMLAFVEQALRDGARLVMAYHSGTDGEGHHTGPDSRQTRRRLGAIDRQMAPLLDALLARHPGLRIILTADHGMATMRRRVDLAALMEGLEVHPVAHGGSAYLYLGDPTQKAEAIRRLRRAGLQVWSRAELPTAFHLADNPRVGDLVALAPLGTWLSQSTGEAFLDEAKGRKGAHAYAPDQPLMQGWLVVLGAGRGNLGEVPLWDLAPTVAAWLGIQWRQAPDGQPLSQSVPK